jgi:prepilin peptidase CpaA
MIATNTILALVLLFTAVAAGFDLRTGHIPNPLTLGAIAAAGALQLLLLGLAAHSAAGSLTAAAIARAALHVVAGAVVCGLVPYLLFMRDGMGGGDVKLLAGVGALLGPVLGLEVELYAFVAMALFACARMAYDGRLLQVLAHSAALLLNPVLPKARRRAVSPLLFSSLKFAPAVFAATALVTLLRWRTG